MVKKTILYTITIVFLLCSKSFAASVSVDEVKTAIVKHAVELGVEPELALSIAKVESQFKHNMKSPYGAVGVFQLLPSTARAIGTDPYCLNGNIRGGLTYYKMMYKMFGSTELALAAYNAGPTLVKKHNNSIPPYKETQKFVEKIMAEYDNQKNSPDAAITACMRKPPKFQFTLLPAAFVKPAVKTSPSPVKDVNQAATLNHEVKIINLRNLFSI